MKTKLTLSAIFLSILSFSSHADTVKTDNGIEVYRSGDSAHWFSIHGLAKLDAVGVFGDFENRRNEFPSGTNIRAIETTFEGGIGQGLTYTVSLSLESGVDVNDAYLTYTPYEHTSISIGQVVSPFCLENANSGKWIPFMERSLPVVALRPCMGQGINIAHHGQNYYLTLASTTPLFGTNNDTAAFKYRSDRITTAARAVFAPINCPEHVLQLGVSGVYGDNSPTFRDDTPNIDGRRFSTRPEIRARNTPSIINSGNMLLLDNYWEWGAEAAYQRGPLLVQAEYLQADIDRDVLPHLTFNGWHAQVAYVLTGEAREHKMNGASFGRVKPRCQYGAWEVAARYSMVDLNDEDIHGGKGNNVSVALNWFYNKHLMVRANYIHANIDPTRELGAANPNPNKRNLNFVGTRLQVVW